MENENLNLTEMDKIEAETEEKLQTKDRFQKLSEKGYQTAKERDEAIAKAKTEADNRIKAEKERDFYKDFSQVSSRYPQAASYQDKILEKVNSGYTTEDATISILAKEGKLQPITADTRSYNVAGGSASTAMSDTGEKPIKDMSQDERRNALMQAEKEGTNLFRIL